MKSYTDLEQSKVLSKILPLESADTILDLTNPDLPIIRAIPYEDSDYNNKYLSIIPCWSLAALLNILPHSINNYIPTLRVINDSYCCVYSSKENYGDWLWFYANNSIDACYEMILKLHELKLL